MVWVEATTGEPGIDDLRAPTECRCGGLEVLDHDRVTPGGVCESAHVEYVKV